MITKLRENIFVETYEEQRQIDVAKLKERLEWAKTEDRMEVKTKPDQETLDYWNNEARMRNEGVDAEIQRIESELKKVTDAGFKIEAEKI